MIYDVIILGATFAAAGMAMGYGEGCLILERRPQAGYEFINAMHFGTNYDKPLKSDEAKVLYRRFAEKGAFCDERVCLFPCASSFYQMLEGKNVLLNMELISVCKENDLFKITAHGVSGYRTFLAKKVVDTTVHDAMIQKKTLNLLVNAKGQKAVPKLPDAAAEQWGYPGDVLIKIPVSFDTDYLAARKAAGECLKKLPKAYKAAFVADCFAWTVCTDYPKEADGVIFVPSASFDNPLLAFDAGVLFAKGGDL